MNKIFLSVLAMILVSGSMAQNVGVRTTTPAYPLDVNGDINTNGALRVSGSPGTGGQVLRSNGNGTMAWDDMCQYNNFVSLQSAAGNTWTVPAGVTRVLIEIWGSGGGGCVLAGGGGGGYLKAHFTVTPGSSIAYTTGDGGLGAGSASANTGNTTTCTVGSVVLSVFGGQGALFLTASNGQSGGGGGYSVTAGFSNFMGMQGEPGQSQERNYFQFNSTTYYESGKAGRGGNSGNAATGGLGQTYLYNTTGAALIFRNGNPAGGRLPGGGGASGVQFGATTITGGKGGDALIIIHY